MANRSTRVNAMASEGFTATAAPTAAPFRTFPARLPPTDREVGPGLRRAADRGCRGLNVAVASLGILATLPLMLVIAAAIKLTSPGPVLFTQERVGLDRRSGVDRRMAAGGPAGQGRRRSDRNGRNPVDNGGRRRSDKGGRIFTIYKFRTMTTGGEARQVWAQEDDPRITRVGAVLRKTRLDELPQLLNVLKGDMNIVGPRPEQPEIFQDLREKIEGYPLRQKVLPGITGWAQINHHYDQCLEDVRKKVTYDLEYIDQRTASEDVRIMARTVPVMIRKKGAV